MGFALVDEFDELQSGVARHINNGVGNAANARIVNHASPSSDSLAPSIRLQNQQTPNSTVSRAKIQVRPMPAQIEISATWLIANDAGSDFANGESG